MYTQKTSLAVCLFIVITSTGNAASVEHPWDYIFKNSGYYYINADTKREGANVSMQHAQDRNRKSSLWNWYGKDNLTIGAGLCLNAHLPGQSSNVNLFGCDRADPEQHWEFIIKGDNKVSIRLMNTDYCLNAHNVTRGSNLNLYQCTEGDKEQLFEVVKVLLTPPEPEWPLK